MKYNTTYDLNQKKWLVVNSNDKVISEFVDMDKAMEYSTFLNSKDNKEIPGHDYIINDGFYNVESFTLNGQDIVPGKYVLKE